MQKEKKQIEKEENGSQLIWNNGMRIRQPDFCLFTLINWPTNQMMKIKTSESKCNAIFRSKAFRLNFEMLMYTKSYFDQTTQKQRQN